jgi:hypothetical protein
VIFLPYKREKIVDVLIFRQVLQIIIHAMTPKSLTPPIMLIVFSIIGFAVVSSGIGIIQTVAFAQTLQDDATTSSQDSSSNDNVLDNNNDFGVDGTAIGQDNEADEDAANVGVQDKDATQEQDQTQDAVNTNLDFDVQVGQQLPPQVQEEPPGPEEPPTTGPTLRIIELNCDRLPEFLETRWRAENLPRDIEGFVLFLEFSDSDRREPVGGAGSNPTPGEIGHAEGGFLTPANGDTGPYTLFFYEDNNLDTIPDEGGLRLTTTFTCE